VNKNVHYLVTTATKVVIASFLAGFQSFHCERTTAAKAWPLSVIQVCSFAQFQRRFGYGWKTSECDWIILIDHCIQPSCRQVRIIKFSTDVIHRWWIDAKYGAQVTSSSLISRCAQIPWPRRKLITHNDTALSDLARNRRHVHSEGEVRYGRRGRATLDSNDARSVVTSTTSQSTGAAYNTVEPTYFQSFVFWGGTSYLFVQTLLLQDVSFSHNSLRHRRTDKEMTVSCR